MSPQTIFWRRLDHEGHDCCRLKRHANGWCLEGVALFLHEARPTCLRYVVQCDDQWCTREATVLGWVGEDELSLSIIHTDADGWLLNDVAQSLPDGLVDLDLGFTPATNTIALRRLALGVGEGRRAPAAYLAFPELRLDLLEQDYRRLAQHRYAYSAPRFSYEAVLMVTDEGFVTSYPGLWEACAGLKVRPLRGR